MINLKSKLENNIFDGVLVKKGISQIEEALFEKLSKNPTFVKFLEGGYILKVAAQKVKEAKEEIKNKPDFSKMSYNDLKKYVKDNKIEVKSLSKADIYEALGISE